MRQREPGDDDDDVTERDEDGNALVPLGLLLDRLDVQRRLGRLPRYGLRDLRASSYAALVERDLDAALECTARVAERALVRAREEYRALVEAGIAAPGDEAWGCSLRALRDACVAALKRRT